MFKAKVYKIAVVSLSGMMEETYAAKVTIRKWNETNAEPTSKLYMLVDDANMVDVLVGVVGNRLENTELIEGCLNAGKNVLLFFSAYQDPKNTIASEAKAVDAFRAATQVRCFCAEYNGVQQLSSLLGKQLNVIE